MPRFNINMQWLVPLATAVWAAWRWATDLERERQRERARISALYVNPFLSACEDLQSRIYSVLEMEGLPTLRRRYPDGSYAEETLYLIVRYFGWTIAVERHGPYTEDPVVMRLASAVGSAFATSLSPQQVGPFNFFQPEQKALGKLVMTTMEGQLGVEPEALSYYEFKQRLASPPLSDSEALKESLEALRNTDDAQTLPGRDRLMRVQNHLVELLVYVEQKVGYTLFQGERKKCGPPGTLSAPAGTKPYSAVSG